MGPVELVLAALAQHGLLLQQDKALPSVVGILTGESLGTSWWSHPKGRLIFSVVSELADHQDVLIAKLLFRKDTFIHRPLWPAFLAVASAREPWQMRGLSDPARSLMGRIDGAGSPVRATGGVAKELEARLLARAHEVHTESGRHVMALESWHLWSARMGCGPLQSSRHGAQALERAAMELGAPLKALPWPQSP